MAMDVDFRTFSGSKYQAWGPAYTKTHVGRSLSCCNEGRLLGMQSEVGGDQLRPQQVRDSSDVNNLLDIDEGGNCKLTMTSIDVNICRVILRKSGSLRLTTKLQLYSPVVVSKLSTAIASETAHF